MIPVWTLALVVTSQAPANAQSAPISTNTDIIFEAITICEQATQGGQMTFPVDAKLYAGTTKIGGIEPIRTLPDLLKRYANNGMSAIDPPSLYLRFIGKDGEAWSIIHAKTLTCDVITTGFRQSERDQEILEGMNKIGWRIIRSVPSTQTGALSQYLLVKMKPIATEPAYGIRAVVKSLGFTPSTAGGVQMEINFAAGKLAIRSPATL